MRLYSYVVSRDYGFAPNPFHGTCTLATCKPEIRRTASADDWIVGTGSKMRGRQDHFVYIMRVAEAMTFNQYWADDRFQMKKPNLRGSTKQRFGDNIYFRGRDGKWRQIDSHHSLEDGLPNQHNIRHDTSTDNVLIGGTYAYWGGSGPKIPSRFRNQGHDLCKSGPGHKCHFPDAMVDEFVTWFTALDEQGFLGEPLDWKGPS